MNPSCVCMKPNINGILECSKGYPKEFIAETQVEEGKYPKYRRPNNGRTIEIKKVVAGKNGEPLRIKTIILDNRHVVPHSAYMLLRYKCNVCVELINICKRLCT